MKQVKELLKDRTWTFPVNKYVVNKPLIHEKIPRELFNDILFMMIHESIIAAGMAKEAPKAIPNF